MLVKLILWDERHLQYTYFDGTLNFLSYQIVVILRGCKCFSLA